MKFWAEIPPKASISARKQHPALRGNSNVIKPPRHCVDTFDQDFGRGANRILRPRTLSPQDSALSFGLFHGPLAHLENLALDALALPLLRGDLDREFLTRSLQATQL